MCIRDRYDGAIAYMDASIRIILDKLEYLGIADDTIVVFTSDHGETLYDHDCYFDHHSMYDNCLIVPLAIKFGKGCKKYFRGCKHVQTYAYEKDIMPTILAMLCIETDVNFDCRNLFDVLDGKVPEEPECYITAVSYTHLDVYKRQAVGTNFQDAEAEEARR